MNNTFYVADIHSETGADIELHVSDFEYFEIRSNSLEASNLFLEQLWDLFDQNLNPEKLDRCPWYYTPLKFPYRETNFTYLGSMRTSIGYIHVGISNKKKGNIDYIYLHSKDIDLKVEKISQILESLIFNAKQEKKPVQFYISSKLNIESFNEYVPLSDYSGENFTINNNTINFKVSAHTVNEAKYKALEILQNVINFLSVETNLVFVFGEIQFLDDLEIESIISVYQNNFKWENSFDQTKFIDFYPVTDSAVVILSIEAIKLIDKIILSEKNKELSVFFKACYHNRNALIYDQIIESRVLKIQSSFILSGQKVSNNKQTIIDESLTGYLSAIETAALNLNDFDSEKCDSCNQLKFSITKRVKYFVDKYFNDEFGDIFKKIYAQRSLYLHTGESVSKNLIKPIRPRLDQNTATGTTVINSISIMIDGRSRSFSIANVREWVSYTLRNYYKDELVD